MDQKVLIDRVEIEEEDQAHQSPDCLWQHIERVRVLRGAFVGNKKGSECDGK